MTEKQRRWGLLFGIAVLSVVLRLPLVHQVPVEVDEDNYLSAGLDYRRAWDARSLHDLTHVFRNYEHPPLVKLLYGLAMDSDEVAAMPQELPPDFMTGLPNSLERARWQAVIIGTLTALVVAFINPFAGVVMAGQTMQVYYTSIAYLDALPVLFVALMAWAYGRQTPTTGRNPYFWLSGAFFGVAVAAKYPYALVGVILIAHALFYRRHAFKKLVGWGLISLAVFFCLNPFIWPDPASRLESQVTFHEEYASGRNYSLLVPWAQMVWPLRDIRYPDALVLPGLVDVVFFALALPGLVLLLKSRSWLGWWWVGGMVFQMLWPTQWIQHNMILIVPYSVGAGLAFDWVLRRYRKSPEMQRTQP